MIYKVGIHGASGRMGREVAALIAEGYRSGDVAFEAATSDSLDGWIDFSRPEGTLALLEKTDVPVVVATTGFTPEQRARLAAFGSRIPLLVASNTSPGMTILQGLLRHLPKTDGFEVLVEESHHRHKKDSPSGTAKTILEKLADRGFQQVTVHSTRAGGLPGDHSIRLVADEEEIVLSHRVWNRRVFARGALEGLRFLLSRKEPGLYTMDDVYGEVK